MQGVTHGLYWKLVRSALARGDDPAARTLSRRGEQMVGRRYVLIEAIVNGRSKARVGDGQWLVAGPDLPMGAEVEVTGRGRHAAAGTHGDAVMRLAIGTRV